MIDNDAEPDSITFFDQFVSALDMLVSGAVANASEDEIEPAEITKDVVTALVCHAYFFAASLMSEAEAVALVTASLQSVSEFDGRKARLDA
jgi:hypothetical protein